MNKRTFILCGLATLAFTLIIAMSANFTIQLSAQALSIDDNKSSIDTAGNFTITYSRTEYGFNPQLIDILYNSETNNLTKITTALLATVKPVVETRQLLDNEEKKLQQAIVDTGFLGIDLSDNGCLSSVCITSSLTVTMNNATNTVHWTGDYAEKAERLFNLEKVINSTTTTTTNSTQAYINNTRSAK